MTHHFSFLLFESQRSSKLRTLANPFSLFGEFRLFLLNPKWQWSQICTRIMEIEKTPEYQEKFKLYNENFQEKFQNLFNNLKPEEKDDYKSSILQDGKKSRGGRPKGEKIKKENMTKSSRKNRKVKNFVG